MRNIKVNQEFMFEGLDCICVEIFRYPPLMIDPISERRSTALENTRWYHYRHKHIGQCPSGLCATHEKGFHCVEDKDV